MMKHLYTVILILLISSCSDAPDALKAPDLTANTIDPAKLALSLASDNVPADGKTNADILLKVSPELSTLTQTAAFSVTPSGLFNNAKNTISLKPDASGETHVFVTSVQEGITYVNATFGGVSKTVTVNFTKARVDTLLLTVTKDNIPADNYSYAEITATVTASDLRDNMKSVSFTADKGTFTNDEKTYSAKLGLDGTVKAYLKCNKAELVRLVATAGSSYSKEVSVRFTPAYPDQLFITPQVAILTGAPGANTLISARLGRQLGTVTGGQTVSFYDSTATGRSPGIFLNIHHADDNGLSTAEYWLQDTTYKGYVFIEGFVVSDKGKVTGTGRILIK